ncbi:site-specific integrase [Aquimarina longa]|uniref:site-specific integrase n=1 Tax=Aquimarina longa TaxID=1080221 RepID=UPI000781E407|nr:site-specific integrase [Aquimarina longa]
MASVKIVLRTNYSKKNGTCPLAIRITQNRKTRFVFTGKYILPKDWDKNLCKVKRSYPNSARLNNFLLKKLSETENIALEADTANDNVSSKEIQKKVQRKGKNVSFFQFGAQRVKSKYLQGVFSVAKPDLSIMYNISEFLTHNKSENKQTVIDGIMQRRKERISKARKGEYNILDILKKEFSKNTTLYFEDINEPFINRFKIFCASYLGQQKRTITNQLMLIRTLYNAAIKDGIVDTKHYPFAGEKEKIRIGNGHKIGLTREEIERIESLGLEENTSIWHTRNVWLFAYYFAGIRISDVLEMRWYNFKDGRLFYTMHKNDKPVSLKVPDKAAAILEFYKADKQSKTDFIFPYLKKADQNDKRDMFVKARNASSLFNKYLKRIAAQCEIDKNLSNHIARHTFGNIAGDAISPLMLQKLYRHSDLKTTINYQANFIHKDADDALDAVLNS